MKKLLFVIAAMVMVMSANAQEFILKGTLKGLQEGKSLVLVPMSHDNEQPIAETKVNVDGTYQFIAKAEFPRCVYLRVKDAHGGELIMVESGVNTIVNADVVEAKSWDAMSMFNFWNVEVINSPLTRKLKQYQQIRSELNVLYEETHEPYNAIWDEINKARQEKNQALVDSLSNSPMAKKANDEETRFFKTVEERYNGAIMENKESYWGPLLALLYMSYFTPAQKDMYESFSKEAQESWYGQKVKSEIFPGGGAGEQAKSIQMKGDDGKVVTLEQICKGKIYLLIDFWASWCGPCRKEIPNVKKQYAAFKDKGFEVLSISTDKDEKAWRKALDEEKLEWPNFRDVMGAADVYNVRAIPAMYLIDAQTKTIIASGDDVRGEKLAAKLAELLQ